jgi:hypothetical protein
MLVRAIVVGDYARMNRTSCRAILLLLLLTGISAQAQQNPVQPYVDPSQLDCPWPKHSFYKQPWRGFLDTRSADDFLHGIGINYNVPRNDDLAMRLLAEGGFKAIRVEMGWSQVNWEETHLNSERRLRHLMALCKQYGIRPNLLLNANHGAPCPLKNFKKKLAADAPKGSRTVKFTDSLDLVPGYSGICNLSGYWAAEVLISEIDPNTGECNLSKPLPKDLKQGDTVVMATLKYLPLYPVGTPEFEKTAGGWVRYAKLVASLAHDAGIEDFDVEIWNELSFGSNFLHAVSYYTPPPFRETKNFLLEGGPAWELARRTVDALKPEHPGIRLIWGFSNTTFFHCPIPQLPSNMDGQSYHPYGTGTMSFPKDESEKSHPNFNIEGFTPTMDVRMPEGWAHEFMKTESLMRHLNPKAREEHPKGVEHFRQYMTEHGVNPPECGIKDIAGSWDLKTKCALRSFCLWLNKGIDTLDYFCAWDRDATSMGLMPTDLPKMKDDVKFEDVATPPMKAIRNLTRAFDGAKPLSQTRSLKVDVTELGEPKKIFEGDAQHPPLWQREAFALLPFQVDDKKFVIAYYAMTYDATKPWEAQTYRVKIAGLPSQADVTAYDPVRNESVALKIVESTPTAVTVELPVTDYPRLLNLMTR